VLKERSSHESAEDLGGVALKGRTGKGGCGWSVIDAVITGYPIQHASAPALRHRSLLESIGGVGTDIDNQQSHNSEYSHVGSAHLPRFRVPSAYTQLARFLNKDCFGRLNIIMHNRSILAVLHEDPVIYQPC
jgi:hypothetical protein